VQTYNRSPGGLPSFVGYSDALIAADTTGLMGEFIGLAIERFARDHGASDNSLCDAIYDEVVDGEFVVLSYACEILALKLTAEKFAAAGRTDGAGIITCAKAVLATPRRGLQ
jgi:hypothetical protein